MSERTNAYHPFTSHHTYTRNAQARAHRRRTSEKEKWWKVADTQHINIRWHVVRVSVKSFRLIEVAMIHLSLFIAVLGMSPSVLRVSTEERKKYNLSAIAISFFLFIAHTHKATVTQPVLRATGAVERQRKRKTRETKMNWTWRNWVNMYTTLICNEHSDSENNKHLTQELNCESLSDEMLNEIHTLTHTHTHTQLAKTNETMPNDSSFSLRLK